MVKTFVQRACVACGETFSSERGLVNTCSADCKRERNRRHRYVRWLRDEGRVGMCPPPRKVGSPDQAKAARRSQKYLRRARCADGFMPPAELGRLVVAATRCAICSVEVVAEHGLPNSKQVDHIVPLNVGGKHVLENVRVVCRTCNLTRPKDGADVAEVSLFQISVAFDPPVKKPRDAKGPDRRVRYSPELRDRALSLRAQGLGYKKIGSELNLKRDTVRGWFRDRG